jgi:hypothetical protein
MTRIFAILILSVFTYGGFAQRGVAPLSKGQKQLNFGTGFTNYGLPIYVSLDFAVHKDVTLTPVVNMKFDNDFTHFGAGLKCDYHWNYLIGIPSNWDFYAGANIGFDFGEDFNPALGLQVGGRWYWSPKWALNLELGGGYGFGTALGVSMKL